MVSWFVVGLIEEELVEEGRTCILVKEKVEHNERILVKERVEHHEREGRASGSGFRKVLLLLLLFFNIVLTWKIVGVSEASVIYID